MKPRRIVIVMEVETDLPVKVLRRALVYVPSAVGTHECIIERPVNKPKVEVIQPVKVKEKR